MRGYFAKKRLIVLAADEITLCVVPHVTRQANANRDHFERDE